MKVTGSQIVIGSIILYLLLRKRATMVMPPAAPVKPAPLPKQDYSQADHTTERTAAGLAGQWEINCYHQVI